MSLPNMAAVPTGTGQDPRYPILGNLVWYGLTDVRIKQVDLTSLLKTSGIDIKYMPPEIRAPDAFRRATTAISTRTPHPVGDGKFENIMVRDVYSDSKEIVRHIIREETDSANKRISYGKIGQAVFNRQLEKVSIGIDPRFEHHKARILKEYRELAEFYTGKHIRDMVYKILHDTNPVNVRPAGGVYFIANTHQGIIEPLEKFVSEINGWSVSGLDYAVFEAVPMLDIEKQRKLIFDKYESQCSVSVDSTLGELAKLLKAPKTPSNKVKTTYINKVKELKSGIAKYEELLERDLGAARLKCQLLQEQVVQLLDKQDVGQDKADTTNTSQGA